MIARTRVLKGNAWTSDLFQCRMSRPIADIDIALETLQINGHVIGMFRVHKSRMEVEVDQVWHSYGLIFALAAGCPPPKVRMELFI